jgi:hypothetical protein
MNSFYANPLDEDFSPKGPGISVDDKTRLAESYGLTVEELEQVRQLKQQRTSVEKIGRDFIARHKDEYLVTPENGKAIETYLNENGLLVSHENVEKAYEALKVEGRLKLLPTVEELNSMPMEQMEATIREALYSQTGQSTTHYRERDGNPV